MTFFSLKANFSNFLAYRTVVGRDERGLAADPDKAEIDVTFADTAAYQVAFENLSANARESQSARYMVESSGMYL